MLALAATVLLLVAGCATNYRNDFDPNVDFTRFRTYGYLEPKEIDSSGLLSNSLVRQRVETLISRQLDSHGLRRVPLDQSPDLEVLYWVGVKEKQQVSSVPRQAPYPPTYVYTPRPGYARPYPYPYPSYPGYPYGTGRWGTVYNDVMVTNYREGTLIVDLIDARTKNLVWRTYLVRALSDNPDDNLKGADRDLEKAFAKFPPGEEAKQEKLR